MTAFCGIRVGRCGVVAAAVLLSSAIPAVAQTSPRPYRGLFRGTPSEAEKDRGGVLFAIGEAYDQNVLGDAITASPGLLQTSGTFTQMTADATYGFSGRTMHLSTSAGTNIRYYSEQHELVGIGQHAGASLTINFSPGTSMALSQTVAYAPSYLHRLFASVDAAVPEQGDVATNYAINDTPSYSYASSIGLTQQLSVRNRISFQAGGRYTDYVGTPPVISGFTLRNLVSYDVGGTFTRTMSRELGLNVGYAYKRVQYYTGAFPSEQDFNIGFEYSHALSQTRRVRLKASTSSALLQTIAPSDLTVLRPQYRFLGDVGLSRQFGRSWSAEGAYHRGVGFIEGIATPVITEGMSVMTSGSFNRRVDMILTSGYAVGEPTVANESRGFTTYTADARVNMAISAESAVYFEYLYYYYDFNRALVPVGMAPTMARNSVRAGLSLWLQTGHGKR